MDEGRFAEVLVDFARTLTGDFSLQRTLDHLIERVVGVLPVTGAGLLLMDGEQGSHRFIAATDDVIRRIEGLQLELGEGPCLEAYRTGRRMVVVDLAIDSTFPRFSPRAVEAGLAGVFSFPLQLNEERIGALELYTTEPVGLPERDLTAAQTLADVIAAYLFNARSRRAVEESMLIFQEQALHDPLTGLPNRALLDDRLELALRSAKRSDTVVGVLFLDVDGLKAVNDTYGHQAGDELLVWVARQVPEVLRPGDTLARLSGDEFVVVCPGLHGQPHAEEVAGRILDRLSIPVAIDGVVLGASVSIGISCVTPGSVTVAEALRRADAAMYAAKSRGGCQSATWHPAVRLDDDALAVEPGGP